MSDILCDQFQDAVDQCLIRHQSVLDVASKFQETGARVNRALFKTVTSCGCMKISAEKHDVPDDISLHELREYMSNHLNGDPCESCREVLEQEIGDQVFYLAAICNLVDVNLYDVIIKENKKLKALGVYNLS